jgi:hypothetical protein
MLHVFKDDITTSVTLSDTIKLTLEAKVPCRHQQMTPNILAGGVGEHAGG